MKYFDIFKQHNNYVSDKWSHYLYIYDEILMPYIQANKPVNLLEIGVQNGGSLEIWSKYLPAGSMVYGIDINKKCEDLLFGDNIHFFLGDATDKSFLDKALKDLSFDIIVDDGSHINKDITKTFQHLFVEKLNAGGIYIAEDLHTSYWKSYGGALRKRDTCIEFFKNCIDSMNLPYITKINFLYSKYLNMFKSLNPYIKRVVFYDSVCAIEKFANQKTVDNFAIVTGNNALVDDATYKINKSINSNDVLSKLKDIEDLYKR